MKIPDPPFWKLANAPAVWACARLGVERKHPDDCRWCNVNRLLFWWLHIKILALFAVIMLVGLGHALGLTE